MRRGRRLALGGRVIFSWESPFCEEYKMIAGAGFLVADSQLGLPHRADNGQAFAVVQKFDVYFVQPADHVRL